MKIARQIVVLAALLALNAVAAGAASATTVEDCQYELKQLRGDTLAAQGSLTNPKDVNNLAAKVEAASAKLAAGKNADAVAKLDDFKATLNLLATAPNPKVDPAVAQTLSGSAQDVIDCINEIGTT
jgi:hypothetical protein